MISSKSIPNTPESVAQILDPLFQSIFTTTSFNTSKSNIEILREHPEWKHFVLEAKKNDVTLIYICKNANTTIGWLPVYEYKKHGKDRVELPKGSVIASLVNVINELYKSHS